MRNDGFDIAYLVLQGDCTFSIGEDDGGDVFELGEGDVIDIPSGVAYQSSGEMVIMASFCVPPYDSGSVQVVV